MWTWFSGEFLKEASSDFHHDRHRDWPRVPTWGSSCFSVPISPRRWRRRPARSWLDTHVSGSGSFGGHPRGQPPKLTHDPEKGLARLASRRKDCRLVSRCFLHQIRYFQQPVTRTPGLLGLRTMRKDSPPFSLGAAAPWVRTL